jgi:hypothetical protein
MLAFSRARLRARYLTYRKHVWIRRAFALSLNPMGARTAGFLSGSVASLLIVAGAGSFQLLRHLDARTSLLRRITQTDLPPALADVDTILTELERAPLRSAPTPRVGKA